MATFADVATIAKARLNDKGFVVRRTAGLLFTLEAGDTVYFVPPQLDIPRQASISWVKDIDEMTYAVGFGDISPQAAQTMVGMHCLIDSEGRELLYEYDESLQGYEVYDAALGHIGTVVSVETTTMQPRLLIDRDSGETVIFPFVDELVNEIDDEGQTIQVTMPKGLLDL